MALLSTAGPPGNGVGATGGDTLGERDRPRHGLDGLRGPGADVGGWGDGELPWLLVDVFLDDACRAPFDAVEPLLDLSELGFLKYQTEIS